MADEQLRIAWNDVLVGVFAALGLVTVALILYVVLALWPPPCGGARTTEYVCVDKAAAVTRGVVQPYYDSDDDL